MQARVRAMAPRLRHRLRRRARASLRLRQLLGAALIAAAAILAALLAAWGSSETARLLAGGSASQARMDLLAQISGRVSDYALVAMDATAVRQAREERTARLARRAQLVHESLAALERAYASAVAEAEHLGETEQNQRAARSLGLARMRANFDALSRSLPELRDPEELRATLDSYAILFTPLLAEAIDAERRASAQAQAALDRLRGRMQLLAVVVAVTASALLVLFHLALIRPLLDRLGRVAAAAEAVGRGDFDATPPVDRHDELGLVFARIGRMAARLGRGLRALERDRARLAEAVDERTAELSAANARLERADAERRRFFADVGHELRTPLTVILAETDLAARAQALSEAEFREALGVIGARARRLNRRIEDLLRVARSESGQIELDDRAFDLARAARDAVADMAPLAKRARVRLAPALPPAAQAMGDPDWSRQVVAGLIENAIRHSYEGGAIEVALVEQSDKLLLSVTDEGEGVPPEARAHLFRRHMRGSDRGLGFGVGLALARWIMERQGGGIVLESPVPRAGACAGARGPGTRVVLRFRVEENAEGMTGE